MVMGKKRKQAKQTSGTLTSRKQKKRRKVQGKGFNRGAKMTKEAASRVAPVNDENTTSTEVKFSGTNTILPRVTSFSRMLLLSSKLGRLSSIKNVFVLLDWLKRMFGCGLQTLGEFLSEKDHKRRKDGENKFEEIVRRMETLEEEVQFLKAENLKMRNFQGCPNGSTLLKHRQGLSERSHPSIDAPVPLAPPPPPPPPPVLAPPPPPLACLKKNQKEKVPSSKDNENMPPRTLVTLEDLKKVKLRKVNAAKDEENVPADSESEITECNFGNQPRKAFLKRVVGQRENMPQCVVNLKDIKRITLKRTKSENEVNTIKLRSPEEMVVMRKSLRKVNIVRSPGGTPLISERNNGSGTGVTPMMTKALRRKFQQAHPYSPDSPKGATRRRQSFSPLTDISVNTPSPLSLSIKKLWS